MQNCPLLVQGESLSALRFRFSDKVPETVSFTICRLGQGRLFDPRPAEKVDDCTFQFPAVVPFDLTPGVCKLIVLGNGPGVTMNELLFVVQSSVEEQRVEIGGVSWETTTRVDPGFSWDVRSDRSS